MKILIAGGTGFVGKKLIEALMLNGFLDVSVLTRDKEKALKNSPFPIKAFEWNPSKNFIEDNALDQVDVVINLAGANIAAGRWSKDRKKAIIESRVNSVNCLLEALEKQHKNVRLINASAIGIYGNTGDREVTEHYPKGDDFLANVCKQWEKPLAENDSIHIEKVILRISLVLGSEDGALKKMLPPFKMGVGGRLGSGKQYMSWIHVDDLVRTIMFLMKDPDLFNFNVFNACTENPVTNKEFTKTLGKVLKRPTIFPVPSFVLKVLLGEMSSLLLGGQKVRPLNLVRKGFQFKYNKLEDALRNILSKDLAGDKTYIRYQWIENQTIENVFNFFKDEKNLEKITPPFLQFKVKDKSTDMIEKGTVINYGLKLHGLPVTWQSVIEQYHDELFFVDKQVKGPYKKWVHMHNFINTDKGVLIQDHITYKVPLGTIGNVFAGSLVQSDLNKIFDYRQKIIKKELGPA